MAGERTEATLEESEFPAARSNLVWSLEIRETNLAAERKMLADKIRIRDQAQEQVDYLQRSVDKIEAEIGQLRDELGRLP